MGQNQLDKGQSTIDASPGAPVPQASAASLFSLENRASQDGFSVAKASHVGRVRSCNEDAYLTVECSLHDNDETVPVGLYVIADGMGGHAQGEIASSVAVRAATSSVIQNVLIPLWLNEERNSQQLPIQEALVQAVRTANAAVYRHTPEAGTTLLVALVMDHHVFLAHVGDSRAYIYSQGTLQQITRDHSLLAHMAESGQADLDDLLQAIPRNVLYRAVGQTDDLIEVDTYLQQLPAGSCLLLCTDGLWDKVPDQHIAAILREAPSPQAAVERLVDAANQNGGDDNITAVLVCRNAVR